MTEFAADDPATRAHEQAKDKAFLFAGIIAVILLAAGLWLMRMGGWKLLGGLILLMLGGSFGFAAAAGFFFRRRARVAMRNHPWRSAAVEILARPPSGKGRTLIGIDGRESGLAVTGLGVDALGTIARTKQLEYAGDLDGQAMVFVRLDGDDRIYVAVPAHPGARSGGDDGEQ